MKATSSLLWNMLIRMYIIVLLYTKYEIKTKIKHISYMTLLIKKQLRLLIRFECLDFYQ